LQKNPVFHARFSTKDTKSTKWGKQAFRRKLEARKVFKGITRIYLPPSSQLLKQSMFLFYFVNFVFFVDNVFWGSIKHLASPVRCNWAISQSGNQAAKFPASGKFDIRLIFRFKQNNNLHPWHAMCFQFGGAGNPNYWAGVKSG
jgi:hypothetical protein